MIGAYLEVSGAVGRVMWHWPAIAAGCGLARRLDDVLPKSTAGEIAASLGGMLPGSSGVVMSTRRSYRDVPRLTHWRIGPYGWSARYKLRPGDDLNKITRHAEPLRQAFRAQVVRVHTDCPGYVRVAVARRDPFAETSTACPAAIDATTLQVGIADDGEPFVIDFQKLPHWLVIGSTGGGKSGWLSAIFAALAPTSAAIVGIDLKHGVEFGPMSARMTDLADSAGTAADVLDRVLALVRSRMVACRAAGVRSVWDLPPGDEALTRPVVVLIDEVAELVLQASGEIKADEAKARTSALLRVVQLSRAAGVYVIVAGQRFGSDLGAFVTSVRAQLAGRLVCRVAEPESARMGLGDVAPDAVQAAQEIDPALPGVAVTAGGADGWLRVRSFYVSTADVLRIARETAGNAPTWEDLAPARGGLHVVSDEEEAS